MKWDEQDRAKLMAYLLESSTRCPSCGTSSWEWDEDRYAYSPLTVQCMGCYIKEISREDDSPPGSRVTLVPKEQAARLSEAKPKLPGQGGS